MYMFFLCCSHAYIYFMCGMCACVYVLRVGVVHIHFVWHACMFYCDRHVYMFPVEQVYIFVFFGLITVFFTKA